MTLFDKRWLWLWFLSVAVLSGEEIKEKESYEVASSQCVNIKKIVVANALQEVSKISSEPDLVLFIGLHVPGNRVGLKKELRKGIGNPLDAERISFLKQQIIGYYQSQNHPFVTVSVPQQEITDGVLQFVVQESVLDEVKVYGNRHFPTKRYTSAIRLEPGNVIDESVLLNNLNFINRNPFRRVDLVYAPGDQSQTTNVELIVKDRFPLSVYAGVDNTGLAHTNRLRWFAGCTWANVFGLDQMLSAQYTAAPEPSDFQAVTISYTAPLPNQCMLQLYGGYSEVHVHLPQSSATHGKSLQASLRLDIPLKPSPRLVHEALCGFDFKRSNNTVEFVEIFPVIGQEVNLTQFMVGYNLGYERDYQNWSHKIGFDIEMFLSPFSWIPDQSQADFESLNPFAKHTYIYGRSRLDYKVSLPKGFRGAFSFAWQLSNQSLLPSEQFGLGGYSTVRGYEERQLNSDDAVLLSGQLSFPTVSFWKSGKFKGNDLLEFLVFMDYGLGHDNHNSSQEAQTAYLLGAGPGVRYIIANYFSSRLDWGIKLHRDGFPGGWSMLHFSVIGNF